MNEKLEPYTEPSDILSIDIGIPGYQAQAQKTVLRLRPVDEGIGEAMRVELIQCDVCETKQDITKIKVLPFEWITTVQHKRYDVEVPEEHHFCSKACLIEWASAKGGVVKP
jgi:hypothetical protein